MLCVDVNVLVHLSNKTSNQHASAKQWLQEALTSSENIVIPEVVVTGFVRVVTDRRILAKPLTVEAAFDFLEAILDVPKATMFATRTRTFPLFKKQSIDLGLHGKDIADSWIAAIALDLDASLVTFDRGFRRFPNLRVVNPDDSWNG